MNKKEKQIILLVINDLYEISNHYDFTASIEDCIRNLELLVK
jgi:hypothetical protein